MNYRVYPVTTTEDFCCDYRVFIDGKEVELNTARVSAYPFNRRWPGHQRQEEQTETVQFLSFAMSAPVHIKVIPDKPTDTVTIRPSSYGLIPLINEDGSFEFDLECPRKITVEPYGISHALHIFADEEKDYGVDFDNPDVLYYGKGVHNIGFLQLKDNQTLFLDEGAVVYGTVHAVGVNNIRILGRGILDNRYNKEKILFDFNAIGNDMDVHNAERVYPLEIDLCRNVEIDGITIRDPLVYNINFCCCENVTVNNVKLIGDWRFNSDGIHFANCLNGSLTDSFLRTYDDSVCVRGLTDEEKERLLENKGFIDVCRNILIENNVIWNDWGICFRIGAATLCEEITDVTFRNNDIIHISSPALDCINCDYADVYDFVYENINIELDNQILEPIIQQDDNEKYYSLNLKKDYCPYIIYMELIVHPEYSNPRFNAEKRCGKLHNFVFRNIHINGNHKIRIKFKGYDAEHLCSDIMIKDLYLNGKKLSNEELQMDCNTFCKNINYSF